MEQAEIDKRFTYHPPRADQPARYEMIRAWARSLALVICKNAPSSREQSLAITALEECVMWANAAIARNEQVEASGQPGAQEISQALDFTCTPPLTISPEDAHNWDVVAEHIKGSQVQDKTE